MYSDYGRVGAAYPAQSGLKAQTSDYQIDTRNGVGDKREHTARTRVLHLGRIGVVADPIARILVARIEIWRLGVDCIVVVHAWMLLHWWVVRDRADSRRKEVVNGKEEKKKEKQREGKKGPPEESKLKNQRSRATSLVVWHNPQHKSESPLTSLLCLNIVPLDTWQPFYSTSSPRLRALPQCRQ